MGLEAGKTPGPLPVQRTGDAAAIAAPDEDGKDRAVLLLQCRKPEQTQKSGLQLRLQELIRRKLGIDCKIELVSRHTLPRTTSGKLLAGNSPPGVYEPYGAHHQNSSVCKVIGFYFSKSDNRLTASVSCNQAIKDQVDAGCRKGYHRSNINAAYRIDDGHTQRIGN